MARSYEMLRFGQLALIILTLALLSMAGCADIECSDDDLLYGVEVLVSEPGGPYDEPVSIRFRVDDGAWSMVDDTEAVDAMDDASCESRGRCFIGFDLGGRYEVEVRRGRASATFETMVWEDFCSVDTVQVPLELPAT